MDCIAKWGKDDVLFLLRCAASVEQYRAMARLLPDPPDASFGLPTMAPVLPSVARAAASRCPNSLTGAQCTALTTATTNYANVVSVTGKVIGYIAVGANRMTGAVKANAPASAFFQEAFEKVNAGALAADLVAEQFYGRALAKLLRADRLDVQLSSRQARAEVSSLPSSVISKATRNMLLSQLSSLKGTVSASALGAPLSSSAFASQYQSITLSELASIVNGLAHNGDFSNAVAQTLINDLHAAQNACANPSQRTAAIGQFIADLRANAPSDDAQFLSFGAQPLTRRNVPASSCK